MGCFVKKISYFPIVRYVVVGSLTNLIGYIIYLLLTWRWLGPKTAISLMYPVTVVLGFYAHGKFSFSSNGRKLGGMLRYGISHCIGYGLNMGLLYVFADLLGYPHQMIQVIAIASVAGVLFLLFRYFVFPTKIRK